MLTVDIARILDSISDETVAAYLAAPWTFTGQVERARDGSYWAHCSDGCLLSLSLWEQRDGE